MPTALPSFFSPPPIPADLYASSQALAKSEFAYAQQITTFLQPLTPYYLPPNSTNTSMGGDTPTTNTAFGYLVFVSLLSVLAPVGPSFFIGLILTLH